MNFTKKDIMLILAGIVLLALEFMIPFAAVRVDVFSDILAYILILVGLVPLIKRNNVFKKCRSTAVKGLIWAVATQAYYCAPLQNDNFDLFMKGVATIFFIYITYYVTESIALEAKMQNKAAVSRNFRITWSVFGVFIFAYYIILNFSFNPIVDIVLQAALVMSAIYYCYTIAGACEQLYMDGLPEHAQGAQKEE